MRVSGSCHCGAVKIEVPEAPTEVSSCNCSICSKIGGLWGYYDPAEVDFQGETARYIWGDRMLALHHCPHCGVTIAWTPLDPDYRRMGVNARVLEGIDLAAIPVREVDGASF